MIRPTNEESDLWNMKDNDDCVKPEFKEAIDEFKIFVLNRVKPMSLHNQTLTGADVVILADNYTKAINMGAIPTI